MFELLIFNGVRLLTFCVVFFSSLHLLHFFFYFILFNIQMFAAILTDCLYIFFIICLHSRNIYFLYFPLCKHSSKMFLEWESGEAGKANVSKMNKIKEFLCLRKFRLLRLYSQGKSWVNLFRRRRHQIKRTQCVWHRIGELVAFKENDDAVFAGFRVCGLFSFFDCGCL